MNLMDCFCWLFCCKKHSYTKIPDVDSNSGEEQHLTKACTCEIDKLSNIDLDTTYSVLIKLQTEGRLKMYLSSIINLILIRTGHKHAFLGTSHLCRMDDRVRSILQRFQLKCFGLLTDDPSRSNQDLLILTSAHCNEINSLLISQEKPRLYSRKISPAWLDNITSMLFISQKNPITLFEQHNVPITISVYESQYHTLIHQERISSSSLTAVQKIVDQWNTTLKLFSGCSIRINLYIKHSSEKAQQTNHHNNAEM